LSSSETVYKAAEVLEEFGWLRVERLRPEDVRPRRYTCTRTSRPKGELFRIHT
jgi:hypothetical protein